MVASQPGTEAGDSEFTAQCAPNPVRFTAANSVHSCKGLYAAAATCNVAPWLQILNENGDSCRFESAIQTNAMQLHMQTQKQKRIPIYGVTILCEYKLQ